MRSRSNSGIRLDYFQRLVNKTILKYQNPATGLIVSRTNEGVNHSWVRDNVYCIWTVWGLSLAYNKNADVDEDRAKAYELEKSVVMLMRGLLNCMMSQSQKLEDFKKAQFPINSLHAKYSTETGKTVVGDSEWGHLQIDATSLYLLTLAQMTASGLSVIYTPVEVAFIQNLVFYIETAYRTPDYGIWERGDKSNHGLPELNSSSIGMAKAALEAINELDLFAAKGGPSSVIHVLPDEIQRCQAILMSMLPRESNSKEVDASLLTIIGFPAFAVDDAEVKICTQELIRKKLNGRYGCARFLRDGHKTPNEDPNRLYYNFSELVQFERIESQWPIFFTFYILDGLFCGNREQVEEFNKRLDDIIIKDSDGMPTMPELYSVQKESVEKEKAEPNSQKREPNGQMPHMWGQSLYILGRLMIENFISPGELDPLNRRQVTEDKPDVVVQVVVLADNRNIASMLNQHGFHVQSIEETGPIQVYPASVLSKIFSYLGKSEQLGLSGRPTGEVGLLATSKLYMLDNKILAFIPQFMDQQSFYITMDSSFFSDLFRTEVFYLKQSWKAIGRPIIVLHITNALRDHSHQLPNAVIGTMKKLQSGYISGTRVHMGKLSDFLTTSCTTQLDFLQDQGDSHMMSFMDDMLAPTSPRPHLLSHQTRRTRRPSHSNTNDAVSGIVRRSRSIQIDPDAVPDLISHLAPTLSTNITQHSPASCLPTSPTFLDWTLSSFASEEDRHCRSSFSDVKDSKACIIPNKEDNSQSFDGVNTSVDLEDNFEASTACSSFLKHVNPTMVLTIATKPSSSCRRSSVVHFSNYGRWTVEANDFFFGITGEDNRVLDGATPDTEDCLTECEQKEGNGGSCAFSMPQSEALIETPHFSHLRKVKDVHIDLPHTSACPSPFQSHPCSMAEAEAVDDLDLLERLKGSESLQEQADIIHYLHKTKSPDWDTGLDSRNHCTVHDLLVELYEKAGHWKQWWLVRHTAGLLRKRIEDLAIAATDLVVRQKQLSVGMADEKIIIAPMPPDKLADLIFEACGDDVSAASLTQEVLVYLAMFIRTEPKLFNEMLRLRVGLIIQVMASEMARTLSCSGEEASDHLLNLGPFEMKTLLHHILSGKEFNISTTSLAADTDSQLSITSKHSRREMMEVARMSRHEKVTSETDLDIITDPSHLEDASNQKHDRQGQWMRRRRLDGSLNRVPVGFYPRIWRVLRRCHGIVMDEQTLLRSLTEEMTEGEFKFALKVETALNTLPEPEYRQLMVEAMMVLSMLVENDNTMISLDHMIHIDHVVREANRIFIADQAIPPEAVEQCTGARNICQQLYDTAPSGRYGSMTYMCRALAHIIHLPASNGDIECAIS